MNIRKPLALALLMTASAASAQFNSGNPATFGFTPTPSPLFNANVAPGDPDWIFKCSTPPYKACNDAELNRRQYVLATRTCPQPVSQPCSTYLMMNAEVAPLQLMGNQANPSTANDEFYKKCGTVPYRNCTPQEAAQRDAWLKGQEANNKHGGAKAAHEVPYDQQPGFVGPPLPPGWGDNTQSSQGDEIVVTAKRTAPKPPSPADFERSFADAKKAHGGAAIDLGNKTYGILNDDDGTITVVGPNGSVKKDQSEYKDKIQQARAEGFAFNGASGGGTPPSGGKTGGQTSGGTPPPANDGSGSSGGGGGGTGLGRSFASDQASISGADGDSSSGGSAGGAASGDGKGYIAVKPSEMQPVGSIQITHTALLKTEADINSAQRAFANGQTGFAAPNAPDPGSAGDPPISPEHLGKIQAVENGPATK